MAGQGGFAFDLCKRNEFLEAKGAKHPGFTKTGTTIAGIIYKARAGAREGPWRQHRSSGWRRQWRWRPLPRFAAPPALLLRSAAGTAAA